MSDEQEKLIEEALRAGDITQDQVDEARTIQKTVGELGITQSLTDILVKKGWLEEARHRALQRETSQRRIGKYEIMEKLGEGGAGVVYRAKHATLGRIVALKVLSSRRASDPQYLESFVREARVAVTLNHRSIVRGIDYGESGGYHFFVMEFVPGDTLYEVLQREGRIEERRALEIGIQVAGALRHALEYDLSHRDLKPDNILLSVETGEAKVCDLGLAKPKKLTANLSDKSGTIGTPSYIAPEQIRGSDQADMRSDIYSLGATLYHAVCGHPVFLGKSVEELLHAHLKEEPRDPREIVVDLSSGTAAVLLKMLEKDPAARYQSLDDLIADLEAVKEGRPPIHTIAFARKEVKVGEGRSRGDVARQRSRSWILLVPVVLVLGIGAALFAILGGGDGDGEETDEPPPVVERPGGTTEDPAVARERAEQNAKAALRRAHSFWRTNPEGKWDQAAQNYQIVLDRYGETAAAAEAEASRGEVLADWKRRATQMWKELQPDLERALENRRYGDALDVVNAFPESLRGAEGCEERRRKMRQEILETADEAWKGAAATAKRAAEDARFDEALAAVSGFRDCGIESLERDAVEAYDAIEKAREEYDTRRSGAEDAFRTLYGSAMLTHGREGYDAAFRLLEQARESDIFSLVQDRIEEAGKDLNRVSDFDEKIRTGFEKTAEPGRPVLIRTSDENSRTLTILNVGQAGLRARRGGGEEMIPWGEISAEQRVEAGLAVTGSMSGESRLSAALWLLAQGRVLLAERQLEAARKLGAETGDYASRLDSVRNARDVRVGELLGQAEVHRSEGRTDEALRTLDEAVAGAPDHAEARIRRGKLLTELRRDGASLADLKAARRLSGVDPEVHLLIARLHERAERIQEALTAYEDYLGTSPKGPGGEEAFRRVEELRGRLNEGKAKELRAAGERALRKGQWKEALEALRAADELVPGHDRTILGIARAAENTGEILLSYSSYRRYLDLRATGSTARDARKSMAALEEKYKLPKGVLEHFVAGEDALRRGFWDKAIEGFNRALQIAPLDANSYFNRAHAWRCKALVTGSEAHAREAIADFDRLLMLEPTSSRALAGRAQCWMMLKKPEKALEDARRAIMSKSDEYLSYNTAGEACRALERFQDAIDYYDRAIELEPRIVRLYVNRARAKWSLNDLEPALEDLTRAGKLKVTSEESVEIRDAMARIRKQRGGR